jgi:hypothetical protein
MNELFTFLSIILVPLSASIFLYLYKSKCSNVKLCFGIVEVIRDVRGEEKTDIINDNNNANIISSI